ncbi:hypothetical protein DL766_001927 [Monosporascus sp. MC13-8B]|uniref:Dynactin arp1 p25 subunit protein n=1 Tax=Monosporascus cannonballus TaxID=155416 RepID=A0ABY0HL80_9PEZI|nr:hypothetical protein DL762_000455 [Monosporascus cannonballus]RYO96148.1 hypothetical protein DL763_003349 [Monosporascus cannonballus]RYP36551.1 hypothetical protein DL766_001927 [Monosporascus sp. MC13-8B]
MITLRWALCASIAARIASASTDELQLISRLLKRQEPGTPAYNCHDNCGQAILQARNSDDVCTDDVFLTDYENCLQCSGPDNVDIWRFYRNSLTAAAEPCGLPTAPLSGQQPEVGPAIPAGSSASPTTSTATTSGPPTASATSASQPTMTTTTEVPTTAAEDSPSETPESPAAAPTAEPTSASTTATSEASVPTSQEFTPSSTTVYETISGSASTVAPTINDGGNGTATAATSSGVVPVTGAANALVGRGPAGIYGALALGAWYAVA